MTVKRIVTNIAGADFAATKQFYGAVLGFEIVMDLGWITTFAASNASVTPQISVASEGGSGTPVPHISIEVDDLDEMHKRMTAAGLPPEYGPVNEPWGIRRFYVRDPLGRLVNIVEHIQIQSRTASTPERAPEIGRPFRREWHGREQPGRWVGARQPAPMVLADGWQFARIDRRLD